MSKTNQSTPTRVKHPDEYIRLMRLTCKHCGLAVTIRTAKMSSQWPHHRCGLIKTPQEFTSGREVTVVRVRSPLTSELADRLPKGKSTLK